MPLDMSKNVSIRYIIFGAYLLRICKLHIPDQSIKYAYSNVHFLRFAMIIISSTCLVLPSNTRITPSWNNFRTLALHSDSSCSSARQCIINWLVYRLCIVVTMLWSYEVSFYNDSQLCVCSEYYRQTGRYMLALRVITAMCVVVLGDSFYFPYWDGPDFIIIIKITSITPKSRETKLNSRWIYSVKHIQC